MAPTLNETTLIVGPSSVGKSTYIVAQRAAGLAKRVHFAFEFERATPPELDDPCIIHYNMLHPFLGEPERLRSTIADSRAMREILKQGVPDRAIVLVIPQRELAKRILVRKSLEADLLGSDNGYPKQEIFEFLCRTDLASLYRKWTDFLHSMNIPVEFLSTSDCEHRRVPDLDTALAVLSDESEVSYSEAERTAALSGFDFAYHAVEGFEDVTANNTDRRDTLKAIRPYLARGSVLDIGCGLGAFCFALERDGFDPVTGTELKKDRFLAASVLREISGSKCKFQLGDVLDDLHCESADNVLMLNVIHHLRDPIAGVLRAATLARSTLILEYPTLDDPKFQGTIGKGISIDPALPLIGVSRLADQDQTFVFSDAALHRILIDNSSQFTSAEFMQSPMNRTRRIAAFKRS